MKDAPTRPTICWYHLGPNRNCHINTRHVADVVIARKRLQRKLTDTTWMTYLQVNGIVGERGLNHVRAMTHRYIENLPE